MPEKGSRFFRELFVFKLFPILFNDMNRKGLHTMKHSSPSHILRICIVGVFSALAIVLAMLVHLPLIPAVSFLEYDPADVPIFLIAAFLGPSSGLIMTVIVSLIQGLTVSASSGWIGIAMHILATGFFVMAECAVLHLSEKKIRAASVRTACAMVAGILSMTIIMFFWNLFITPSYMHMPLNDFLPFLPYIVLFNFFKSTLNGGIAWILYQLIHKPVAGYIPHKN